MMGVQERVLIQPKAFSTIMQLNKKTIAKTVSWFITRHTDCHIIYMLYPPLFILFDNC